jgi:cellulose synthase/poly-beta-1,6-N-acetylglucosamine synthase-like glycosyltransferase
MILNFKKLFLLKLYDLFLGHQHYFWNNLWSDSDTLHHFIFIQHLMNVFIFIAILLSLFYYAIIIYYRFAYKAIPIYNTKNNIDAHKPSTLKLQPSTFLSIIIPARNEAANIENCLNSILQNNYPTHLLQIIVVDDHSEDETAAIVKKFAVQNVQLISLKDFVTDKINSYKKKAIEVAIAQASGTLIITTDADCTVPPTWLNTIASFYEEKKPAFIAAPVFIKSGLSFIQIFQTLDFMTLQGITAAVVHKNQMTMCNGANMAYDRSEFYEVGGFAGIDNIASGDDMLLMHKIYKKYPTRVLYLKSDKAIVQTNAVNSINEFFNQRIRWASKADKYDDKRILPVLVLVYFFNVMMLLLPIVGLFYNNQYSMFNVQCSMLGLWLWLLLFKIIVELFFLFPVASFYSKLNLLWWFPVLQLFHICYTIVAGWLGKFGKYTWKQRQVK